MSVKTWKREFAVPDANQTILKAPDGMIWLWTGSLKKNLRKHEGEPLCRTFCDRSDARLMLTWLQRAKKVLEQKEDER